MSDLSVASSLSSSSSVNQSQWSQRRSQFDQLGQALQAGDLVAAQKAFAALQQNAPTGASQNDQEGSRQKAFEALGQALQSGDLDAAKQAFSQLQQTGGHRHHHHQKSEASAPNTPFMSSTPSTEQNSWAQRKALFDQVGQALESGDLAGAQKAFAALQQNAPTGASQNDQDGPRQQAIEALAKALQSGDLDAAKQAFAALQQAGGHHRHHRPATDSEGGGKPAPAATGSTGNNINLTA